MAAILKKFEIFHSDPLIMFNLCMKFQSSNLFYCIYYEFFKFLAAAILKMAAILEFF